MPSKWNSVVDVAVKPRSMRLTKLVNLSARHAVVIHGGVWAVRDALHVGRHWQLGDRVRIVYDADPTARSRSA